MTVARKLLIASLFAPFLAAVNLHAAATVDFSDQWWAANESGWGASIHQQSNTLAVNLLVYGVDGRPTWFLAAATRQAMAPDGHTLFAGDLYSFTGSYFGGPFSSASVNARKVGTLSFDASSANSAIVSYSVDGVPVVKNVTRYTWSYENLNGSYSGGWSGEKSGCIMAPYHGAVSRFDEPLSITVVHDSDNSVSLAVTFADDVVERLKGTYSQVGHLGRIEAVCPDNMCNITISEIETTPLGFSGRIQGDLITSHWRDWCDIAGTIEGLRR